MDQITTLKDTGYTKVKQIEGLATNHQVFKRGIYNIDTRIIVFDDCIEITQKDKNFTGKPQTVQLSNQEIKALYNEITKLEA